MRNIIFVIPDRQNIKQSIASDGPVGNVNHLWRLGQTIEPQQQEIRARIREA